RLVVGSIARAGAQRVVCALRLFSNRDGRLRLAIVFKTPAAELRGSASGFYLPLAVDRFVFCVYLGPECHLSACGDVRRPGSASQPLVAASPRRRALFSP